MNVLNTYKISLFYSRIFFLDFVGQNIHLLIDVEFFFRICDVCSNGLCLTEIKRNYPIRLKDSEIMMIMMMMMISMRSGLFFVIQGKQFDPISI